MPLAKKRWEEITAERVLLGGGASGGARCATVARITRRQVWLRNQFIRMLPYMPWRGLVAGGVQTAASAITLKDYRDVYA